MQCIRVPTARDRLLDPMASEWSGVAGEAIALGATPLANQPSEYVKASRNEDDVGKVRNVMVQTAHDGNEIFIRLSWEDAQKNVEVTETNMFPDACGVLMPLNGDDAPIDEMGSQGAPVNAWYWRAGAEDEAHNMVAHGLGTTRPAASATIEARSVWGHGAWSVVFARALAGEPEAAVDLAPGRSVRIGFAVWEGSNGERAGIKSFSKEWRELALQP